ncbi:DnaD domain-containing protein [Clostridium sp. 001]|uniref:DnaD domain-containing protein n=1 Tax=Clostridium sp. 001 TaxID=1970093 RepID=UPI001C2CC12D|nr:DnaD domain protein [Clostridium sp. 001]QXE18715.1 chromosomal replication initiator DnaA [Clostridium sp. 001]
MAKYRQLHTDFWNDGFVLDLTPEEKFFYIYLMTNSNTTQCGIYELPKRIIETQTGYNRETVDKLLLRFQEYKKIFYLDETKEIMILNWIKYNKPNNLNSVKCVNRELKNVKNKEFVSLFYKQCLNEQLDIESIFDGIEIENSSDSENEAAKDLKEPLISKEVISNKQKIINNKQEVRSNKSTDEPVTFDTYGTVLAFFEENIHSAGESEREKLRMWSSVIDFDVIILAVEEALKYNARNINYVGRILQSWRRKGLKTANDVKRYKNIGEQGGKCGNYDFKKLERQMLGWSDG